MGKATGSYHGQTVSDTDPSHYCGVCPPCLSIDIEKHTNGEDADSPIGPKVLVGDTVTWTYIVTNPGDVALTNIAVTDNKGVTPVYQSGDTNGDAALDVDETWIYQATGTATAGQYENLGEVTGWYLDQSVSDSDLSHYCGIGCVELVIDIEKHTNGEDADTAPGPTVLVGDTVTWTYIITNNNNIITLTNIEVTDDILGPIGTIDSLDPGESATLTHTGIVTAGQYVNIGTATAEFLGQTITDTDASHHSGVYPTSDSTESTNGDGGQGEDQNGGTDQSGSDGQDGNAESQGDSSDQDGGNTNPQEGTDDQNGDMESGDGSDEGDSMTVGPGESDDDSGGLTAWGLAGAILAGIIAFVLTIAFGVFLRRRPTN